MTLKESIISAASEVGFTVLDSFARYDIARSKDVQLAFISDESCEFSEEWIGIGGIVYRETKRQVKITAFASSDSSADLLTDAVAKIGRELDIDDSMYGVRFTISEPKRSAAHDRVYCEAHLTACEMTPLDEEAD